MAAYLCAEDGGGCGTLWTPDSDRRPVREHSCRWAWCPDCQKAREAEDAE